MTGSESVLAYWAEHREQMRQSENQRAALTNYILAIAAALSGFIVQQDFKSRSWPLAVFVIATGLYGALAMAKYHERANYHLAQARALTKTLTAAGDLPDHRDTLTAARRVHTDRFPRLVALPLHRIWTGLHLGVALYGAVLLTLVLGH